MSPVPCFEHNVHIFCVYSAYILYNICCCKPADKGCSRFGVDVPGTLASSLSQLPVPLPPWPPEWEAKSMGNRKLKTHFDDGELGNLLFFLKNKFHRPYIEHPLA